MVTSPKGVPLRQRAFGMLKRLAAPQRQSTKHAGHPFPEGYYRSFMVAPGKPVWTPREYGALADEAYTKNVVAYQSIAMVSKACAGVPWKLYAPGSGEEIREHPLLALLRHPHPGISGTQFIENMVGYRLISGNAYVLAIGAQEDMPRELHLLRPDRVQVIAGKNSLPEGYRYATGNNEHRDFYVNRLNGQSPVLHLKTFHPLNDWYGLSPVEAAAYSIDQHNQAGEWNQALLQNGARPSGALVVKGDSTYPGGSLSEEQYRRIKNQIDEEFTGAARAGRPLLLEGGLDWREMSISPRDMDFLNAKHSSARDIALAFGVPPQLLGIPGDNTYSNLAEARLALWEQTVLPLLDTMASALNSWLASRFGEGIVLRYDRDAISALSPRREKLWERLEGNNFLTVNEKRALVGYGPIEGGDTV